MEQMAAAQFRRYGGPEVLEVVTVPRPIPGPDEVLVRVGASAVNQLDMAVRSGALKMMTGRKFPMGVGLDFAGEVAAVGSAVSDVAVGARVWGAVSPRGRHVTGSAAEYVVVPADRVSPFPERLSIVEAASMVTVGTTSITAVRDIGRTGPGTRVLVRGAAGGVGMIAVQLAHALGAHVTALARREDTDFVLDCGADEVLDYRTVGAASLGPFDVIVDMSGRDLLAFRRRLARHGRMIAVNFGSGPALGAIAASTVFGGRRIHAFSDYPDRRLLTDLADLVESGAVRPIVGTVYPLDRVAEAHRALSTPGRHGKLVLTTNA